MSLKFLNHFGLSAPGMGFANSAWLTNVPLLVAVSPAVQGSPLPTDRFHLEGEERGISRIFTSTSQPLGQSRFLAISGADATSSPSGGVSPEKGIEPGGVDRATLLKVLGHIEETLLHDEHEVRMAGREDLDEILPMVGHQDRIDFADRFVKRLWGWRWWASERSAEAISNITPHLDPSRRLEYALKVLERFRRIGEYSYKIPIVSISRDLNPTDLVTFLLEVERLLEGKKRDVLTNAMSIVAVIIPRLEPEMRLEHALKIEAMLDHRSARLRRDAIWALRPVVSTLDPADRQVHALKIAGLLGDSNHEVRDAAASAVPTIIAGLESIEGVEEAFHLEEMLEDPDCMVREFAIEMLGQIIPNLEPSERISRMKSVEEGLADDSNSVRKAAINVIGFAMSYMDKDQHIRLALKIYDRLGDKDERVRDAATRSLRSTLDLLPIDMRMKLILESVALHGLNNISMRSAGILFRHIDPQAFAGFAKRRGIEALIGLSHYYAAGMPLDDYFLAEYLESPDPAEFLERTAELLAEYRRGTDFDLNSEMELHLAYAGLDSPEGLSLEKFRNDVSRRVTPPAFLNESFTDSVRTVHSVHSRIDKGKLSDALAPLDHVRSADAFRGYLLELMERENGALKRIRSDLQRAFPSELDGLDIEAVLPRAGGLLKAIWTKRKSVPVRDLILNISLLLAWHREGTEGMREKMLAARGDSLTSEVLWEGLKATEEFYRDTLEDAMQEAGVAGDGIHFIREQRRILAAEVEGAREVSGEEVEVEFVPSKNQADRFFGYVGEDCTKDSGEAIYRDDFQVYRMVSQGRLAGMIYLQEAQLDGNRVLVMGIQPRSFWDVDHDQLLGAIERNFSRIAAGKGYDYVLLMDDSHQQTNRQDMLSAIRDREYSRKSFRKKISGDVFSGKNFLTMWSSAH